MWGASTPKGKRGKKAPDPGEGLKEKEGDKLEEQPKKRKNRHSP